MEVVLGQAPRNDKGRNILKEMGKYDEDAAKMEKLQKSTEAHATALANALCEKNWRVAFNAVVGLLDEEVAPDVRRLGLYTGEPWQKAEDTAHLRKLALAMRDGLLSASDLVLVGMQHHKIFLSAVVDGRVCRVCTRTHSAPPAPDTDSQLPAAAGSRQERCR